MSFNKECAVCEGTSFENIDGFYYCLECGTKSQNVCDIEHSDDEMDLTGVKHLTKQVQKPAKKVDENEAHIEKNIEDNFSTYEVFTHLLKRQCDDLIKLGVRPVFKDVVLRLWAKYLNKLEICFLEQHKFKSNQIELKNVKRKRDQHFFEIYNMHVVHEEGESNEINKMEVDEPKASHQAEVVKIKPSPSVENVLRNIKKECAAESESDSDTDDMQVKIQNESHEDEFSNGEKQKIKDNLINFETIKMTHTVALLNLALLIIKSQILLTDLIRFIHEGLVAYFNIDEVLPESMKFVYSEDSSIFNVYLVPNADFMRYLTSKLGQYLELKRIEVIATKLVARRFVLDLNLPDQISSLVNVLLIKVKPIDQLDLSKAHYENLEALALSYIYVVMLILFFYDCKESTKPINRPMMTRQQQNAQCSFELEQWIKIMQPRLSNIKRDIFGCEAPDVSSIDDLKSLNFEARKHRFRLNTVFNIIKYRKKEVKEALMRPLNVQPTIVKSDECKKEMYQQEQQQMDLSSLKPLFYISGLDKQKYECFSSHVVTSYLTEEKFLILESAEYESVDFDRFLAKYIYPSHVRGEYLLGLNVTTLDWLIERFQVLAQASNYNKMFKYIKAILNKLTTRHQ